MRRPWLPVLLAVVAIGGGWILFAERDEGTVPLEPAGVDGLGRSPEVASEEPRLTPEEPIPSVPFEEPRPVRATSGAVASPGIPVVASSEPASQAESFPIVSGRLVRRDGTAWPPVHLRAWPNLFPDPEGGRRSERLGVAEGGRFRLVLRLPCPPGGTRRYRLILDSQSIGQSAMETTLDLSRDFPPGETDIGDVVLDHGLFLATGIVIDQDGQPVAEALVRARQKVRGRSSSLTRTLRTSGAARTGEDGHFELWLLEKRDAPEGDLELWALHDDHPRSPHLECPVGARGLRLVLPHSGGLAGSFRFAPGQGKDDLHAELVTAAGPRHLPIAADGSFAARRLPRGELTFRARHREILGTPGSEWDLLIDGIEIEADQTCRDPRLQEIELPGMLHRITLTVVDERGAPIPGIRLRRSDLDPGRVSELTSGDPKGEMTIQTRTLPLDVEIRAYGYRPQRIEGLAEDRKVILKRGVTVRLVASGPVKGGSNPGWQLGIHLWELDGAGERVRPHLDNQIPGWKNYFSPEGEILLRLPPGSYELLFSLVVIQTGAQPRSIGFSVSAPPRFTVHDGDAEQRIPIEIPEKKIRELLRQNHD